MRKSMLFLCLQCISFVAFSQTWILKWQDSFEANASPDTTVWSLEKDGRGGGNSELQCYLPDNVSVETYQGLRCLMVKMDMEPISGTILQVLTKTAQVVKNTPIH
ncbi:MAG: hypothetical protein H6Q14_834 [Bacteroidetes bacterium]|nr:hypothetical protein [Bacteroidota bacterium]